MEIKNLIGPLFIIFIILLFINAYLVPKHPVDVTVLSKSKEMHPKNTYYIVNVTFLENGKQGMLYTSSTTWNSLQVGQNYTLSCVYVGSTLQCD